MPSKISIIVTRDTDFGEVLRYPKHPGAIIFRLPYTFTVKEINKRLKEFLTSVSEDKIRNAIVIVELSRYRRKNRRLCEMKIAYIYDAVYPWIKGGAEKGEFNGK